MMRQEKKRGKEFKGGEDGNGEKKKEQTEITALTTH